MDKRREQIEAERKTWAEQVAVETKLHNSKQTEANADLPCKLDNN